MMTEVPADLDLQRVRLKDIDFSPFNRRDLDESHLQELAHSIEAQGLIEPVILRPNPNRTTLYELVAGERRVRAARIARLEEVPAVIRRDLDDRTTLELMIVENLAREDLNPVLEAEMLDNLVRMHEGDVTEVARRLGKSKVYVNDRLDLLTLPGEVQTRIRKGELTLTHGKALADLAESDMTKNRLAKELVETGTSAAALKRTIQRRPAPTTTREIGEELRRFGLKAAREARKVVKCDPVSFHLHPSAETWAKVKAVPEAGEFSGQVRRVKAFHGRAEGDAVAWRVQFVDTGGVPWSLVERLAPSADAAKGKGATRA